MDLIFINLKIKKMKKQSFKNIIAFVLPLISVAIFSVAALSANAQNVEVTSTENIKALPPADALKVEGPPRPGYFCRCSLPGYGCAGSFACLSRCSIACHSTTFTEGVVDSVLLATTIPISLGETEMQKRIHQMQWVTTGNLNTPGFKK